RSCARRTERGGAFRDRDVSRAAAGQRRVVGPRPGRRWHRPGSSMTALETIPAEPVAIQPDTAQPALVTHALTRRFGELTAVDHVELSVAEGEILGLLGSNGAGKSTTIRMLTTLLPPTSGTAEVAGSDIVRDPSGVRRSIGYVPQLLSADGTL